MRKYKSPTVNGGTTIVFDSVKDAIALGEANIQRNLERYKSMDQKTTVPCGYSQRSAVCDHCSKARADHNVVRRDDSVLYFCDKSEGKQFSIAEKKSGTVKASVFTNQFSRELKRFGECAEAIIEGSPQLKDEIMGTIEAVMELVADIAPQLSSSFAGMERSEDGFTASPELVAAGEEQCCHRRKQGADNIREGKGEGAYRIVISTDVESGCDATSNAVMVGALVCALQQFKPVEVWIQQGWLGEWPSDGVTLFRLDFNGAFDPTALTFWLGHPEKDAVFSRFINTELGRGSENTATTSEIPCDIYLRGDWMKEKYDIDRYEFQSMLHTERVDLLAKWVAETAVRLVFEEEKGLEITV